MALSAFVIISFLMVELIVCGKTPDQWRREELTVGAGLPIRDRRNGKFEVLLNANFTSLDILLDNYLILSETFEKVRESRSDYLGRYASVTVAIVKPSPIPVVMSTTKFMTGQPSESRKLVSLMKNLQKGRLGIIVGTPDFLKNLNQTHKSFLSETGSSLLSTADRNDHWVMIWATQPTLKPIRKLKKLTPSNKVVKTDEYLTFIEGEYCRGNRSPTLVKVFVETLIVALDDKPKAGPLSISFFIDVIKEEPGCPWLHAQELRPQLEFCERFDGYGDLCSCSDPFIPSRRTKPDPIPMKEDIPIVIVTANKPHHLYRLLRNLDLVRGSGETNVLVVVDGYQEEGVRLAELFGFDVRLHRPQGNPKDNTRTNMNIGFALWAVFDQFPSVDKAILLEDDLLLSPDMLSYFHQTSRLLDGDETLAYVNAFGQNSYPLTAANLSTVLRVEMYPQYGWLTTRTWAQSMFSFWVKEGKGVDWDWWMYAEEAKKGRHTIVPEVSRTGHAGSAGAHVSGYQQFYYFDTRIMSSSFEEMPRLDMERLSPPEKYKRWMDSELRAAHKIKLVDSPCNYMVIPQNETGPFVIFLGVGSRNDNHSAFYLMQACFGTDETDLKEVYDGVMRLHYLPITSDDRRGKRRVVVYLVGCPLSSSFCKYSEEITDWIYPSSFMLEKIPYISFWRRHVPVQ